MHYQELTQNFTPNLSKGSPTWKHWRDFVFAGECESTWSNVRMSGESPPCTHRTCPSIKAATVSRSNTWNCPTLLLPWWWNIIDQKNSCLDGERWLPCNNIAKHCSFHICSDTRRRNRTPGIDDQFDMLIEGEGKKRIWLSVKLCKHLRDLPWFMVAPEQCHFVRPPRLEDHQPGEDYGEDHEEDHDEDYDEDHPPCERLQTVVAPVHKVSHEDIVGVWRWAAGSDQERDMLTTNIININIIKSTKIDLKSSSRS